MTKPFDIPKALVWEAFKRVKANRGAAGVDNESIVEFEGKLSDNLYKLWNRLSSGSYIPPPVKSAIIPKKTGGVRILGVPTVADRIAQTVVNLVLEPVLEPVFHQDSYGYRPGRSAHDALAVVRKRSWEYNWVVEFDIKSFFDNIDHELLFRALCKHCNTPWVLLYIKRWLKAPMKSKEGEMVERNRGTPQGGVISPLLANLFLHYAFDIWIARNLQGVKFCRYADDGVIHCKSLEQARTVLQKLEERLRECKLEMHSEKSQIVYCKNNNRRNTYPVNAFTFLGYTFRPRRMVDKRGRADVGFIPAVSRKALTTMRQTVRSWHIQLKVDESLTDLSKRFNPILRGWLNYYGRFYASALVPLWHKVNDYLARWLRRKYKHLERRCVAAFRELKRLALANSRAFVHWELGIIPTAG